MKREREGKLERKGKGEGLNAYVVKVNNKVLPLFHIICWQTRFGVTHHQPSSDKQFCRTGNRH